MNEYLLKKKLNQKITKNKIKGFFLFPDKKRRFTYDSMT